MPKVDGIRFDAVRLTASSESNARDQKLDTLQIHHATTKSLSGLESLMAPGGRTVSANGALGNDGTLVLKVPLNRRAFTSATQTDERSFTVEVCNTSYDPHWGISSASHERLAVLLLDLHDRFGVPLKRGMPGVIGHKEVPGTYATACPGPSMNLDRIVRRAKELKQEREDKALMASLDDATIKRLAKATAEAVWNFKVSDTGTTFDGRSGVQAGRRLRGIDAKTKALSGIEAAVEDLAEIDDEEPTPTTPPPAA